MKERGQYATFKKAAQNGTVTKLFLYIPWITSKTRFYKLTAARFQIKKVKDQNLFLLPTTGGS